MLKRSSPLCMFPKNKKIKTFIERVYVYPCKQVFNFFFYRKGGVLFFSHLIKLIYYDQRNLAFKWIHH